MRVRPIRTDAGFSLVEMLTVIAVIGILAAVALTQISRVRETAELVKDKTNAQQIVSIYHAARSMGLDFNGTDMTETIENVVTGAVVPGGSFKGTYFGLPEIIREQRERAARFINVEGGALQYMGSQAEEDSQDRRDLPQL